MKKYNTRPIDFTDCHPVIAEHLKRGEDIKCRVWDFGCDKWRGVEAWVWRYRGNSSHPYRADNGTNWRYAEPIPLKAKRIMPPERAIPALIAGGWFFMSNGVMCGPGGMISHEMFRLMGRPLDDHCVGDWSWPACIIEEVNEDE